MREVGGHRSYARIGVVGIPLLSKEGWPRPQGAAGVVVSDKNHPGCASQGTGPFLGGAQPPSLERRGMPPIPIRSRLTTCDKTYPGVNHAKSRASSTHHPTPLVAGCSRNVDGTGIFTWRR